MLGKAKHGNMLLQFTGYAIVIKALLAQKYATK
jgi:hypothetical protein